MISTEVLRSFPHFADADHESLRKVAMITEIEQYPAGAEVFHDGEPAAKLYIVVEGQVDLGYEMAGGEMREIDHLAPGELVMWSALVEPYMSTAIARCRGETKLVAIDAEKLRALCDQEHDLGYVLLRSITKILADRLTNARVQLAAAN